jgi:hypothetical protein
MHVTLEIPDELAASLALTGRDPARAALEAIGLEAYRERRLTGYQLRTLLGIPSRHDLDGFLKEHRVEKYTTEDFERDVAAIRHIEEIRKADSRA